MGDGSSGSTGIEVAGSDGFPPIFPPSTGSISVRSTIVRGFSTDLKRSGGTTSAASANLTVDYSNFDPAKVQQSGMGALTQGAGNTNVDPSFVDASGLDFRLRADSPLLDAGDPASPQAGESAVDLDGSPRRVDGNGDGLLRADMGAFEFQPRPPSAAATATPTTVNPGQGAVFDGSGSSDPDPGDALRFAWSFDDGTSATGAVVRKAFATPGTHAGTLTVTDRAGHSATATARVTVLPSTTPPKVVDKATPVITQASMTPKTWAVDSKGTAEAQASAKAKKGTTFTYSLSEPARVVFTIEQALPGRKVSGKCKKPSRSNRKQKKCTRYTRFGSFAQNGVAGKNTKKFSGRIAKKTLKPGTYRASLTATDAAGNKSKVRQLSFTIVRR